MIILDVENFISLERKMPPEIDQDKNPVVTEKSEVGQIQNPSQHMETGAKEVENSVKTNEATRAELETTSGLNEVEQATKTNQVVAETKKETNEVLTEDQKAQEIVSTFQKLHTEIQPDKNGNVILTPEQIQAFERIDELRKSQVTAQQQVSISERTLLVNDESLRKAKIKELKKEIRAEKRAKNDLRKIAKLEADLVNIKNHNNYNYSKANTLEQINQALDTGVYINTPLAFFSENKPLIIDLYKNCKNLKGKNQISLPYQGREIVVYNGTQIQKQIGYTDEHIQSCGGYANVVEKWATEKTKMNQGQARNMVNTLGTVGMIGGIVLLGRWLFTEKDKEGNRKFGFSFGKLAALIGIPLAVNYGSQMATGKGFMSHLENAWKTGKMPRETEGLQQATENEKIALGLNTVQFALLGVPYSVLAQGMNPKTGLVSSMDTKVLQAYYTTKIEEAKANNDTKNETIFKSQLEAVKSIDQDKNTQTLFNTSIANMQINADELSDQSKQSETLNEKIYQKSERYQQFDAYLQSKKLTIAPEQEAEIAKRLFEGKSPLKDSDFEKMLKEGLLIPNDTVAQELKKLNLPETERLALHSAFQKMANNPSYKDLSISIDSNQDVKLSANGKEIILDTQKKTIPDFVNSAGDQIAFSSMLELLQTGLFVNALKANNDIWKETPDLKKKNDSDRPFALASGASQIWQGPQSLIFKKHNGENVIMNNWMPFFSQMDWKYPTIETGNNRTFFIQYLNRLWKAEHPTSS